MTSAPFVTPSSGKQSNAEGGRQEVRPVNLDQSASGAGQVLSPPKLIHSLLSQLRSFPSRALFSQKTPSSPRNPNCNTRPSLGAITTSTMRLSRTKQSGQP